MPSIKPILLITGATGFVGKALTTVLLSQDYHVVAAVRSEISLVQQDTKKIIIGNLSSTTDWSIALKTVEVVIHTAARVHIMNDSSADPLANFKEVNTFGTLNLASQAAKTGVKRFIFISSVKVNGESTEGKSFSSNQPPNPQDPYGVSKYEAEESLKKLAFETGMEVVIIRPPLIYGVGVKGNLQLLARVISKGIPLPFGAVNNRRNLVSLDNLCNLIVTCIEHPGAANQIFLVSDDQPLSTSGLIKLIAKGQGRKARLFSVPVFFLKILMAIAGKSAQANRLFGDLEIDISRTKSALNWTPPFTIEESFHKMFRQG